MFTGIIKAKGSITRLERRGGDVRLSIRSTGLPFPDYTVGESIAVNGVCLTAVALREGAVLGGPGDGRFSQQERGLRR